ncbi:3985_t:CDS:2, partial [Acaulospora morrowiae]
PIRHERRSTSRPRFQRKEKKEDKNNDNPKIKYRDAAIIRTSGVSFTLEDEKIDNRISEKVYSLLVFLDGHQDSGTLSIIGEEDGGFPNSVTPKASDLTLESLCLYKSEDEFDSIDLGEPTCNGMTAPI